MSPPHPLALTGERTVPGVTRENYWFRRHEAVYRWVTDRELAGPILEAGSGEGYGANLLAESLGQPVVALDYDADSVAYAARQYPGVALVRANLAQLPVSQGRWGAVVSLQVIEHLWDVSQFLADATAALRSGGTLIVSTPNRVTFSPGVARGEKPTNPFHVEEFDAQQLHSMLIDAGLVDVTVLGLSHGERLTREEQVYGSLVDAQVRAILDDQWTDELVARVAAVTCDDFIIDSVNPTCCDLIATGVRP